MQHRVPELTLRRNAEIVVPSALPLTPHLRFVFCRSAAERQTLLHLLSPAQSRHWDPLIRVARDRQLFERRGVYVESVAALADERVMFRFNPAAQERGSFRLAGTFKAQGLPLLRFGSDDWTQPDRDAYLVRLRGAQDHSGELELLIDDDLAFRGQVGFEPLPF